MHRKITADVELAYPSSQTENRDEEGMCFGSAGRELGTFTPDNFVELSFGYRMFLLLS